MSHYYFGLNLYIWIALAFVFLNAGVYIFWRYTSNKTKLKRNSVLISLGLSFMIFVLSFDLSNSYIDESKLLNWNEL